MVAYSYCSCVTYVYLTYVLCQSQDLVILLIVYVMLYELSKRSVLYIQVYLVSCVVSVLSILMSVVYVFYFVFFFFKQKTAYEMRISDWSSDVCSSDLRTSEARRSCAGRHRPGTPSLRTPPFFQQGVAPAGLRRRHPQRLDIADLLRDDALRSLWALEIEGEVAAGATIEDRAVYPDEVFHFRVLDVHEPDFHPGEVLGIVGEGQILLARRQAVDLIGAAQATQQEGDGVAEADAILFQSEEIIALAVGDLHGRDEVEQAVVLIVNGAQTAPHGGLHRAVLVEIVERRIEKMEAGLEENVVIRHDTNDGHVEGAAIVVVVAAARVEIGRAHV